LTPWRVPPQQVTRLPSRSDDFTAACGAYEAALEAAGGLDLCILGIGPNGHLGFNEPPVARDAPTRVVELTPASIASNAAYWGGADQVPRRAITAGMRVILSARQTILLASGEHKRDILRQALTGPVTPDVPASYLQTIDGVSVYADRAAAGA
ncbi:MAG TPA: 6-phosphogluconolactonase, partial [Thermomicrobiales bacterium]|nr:6-phosphogluconolactonase [Thermomicrobiales bacterium]